LPGVEPVDLSKCGDDNKEDKDANESEEETDNAELCKCFTSPIYTFFGPVPNITYNSEGHRAHEFCCSASICKCKGVNGQIVQRYLDTADCKSTSNLKRHAMICWGAKTVNNALEAKINIDLARTTLGNLKDRSITAAFERKGKGKVLYLHRQHTKTETRAKIVCWVSESMHPFSIVEDHGFHCLMKTGRPEYYLPSCSTVS
ncbi:hypothetical protein B0H34DRAFT_635228, partial [Crassisporium funariophilum]